MRYINLALILKNGCTASTQVYTADRSVAMRTFEKLIADANLQHNPAILGNINDGHVNTRFAIDGLRARIIKEEL
jgi:hypothetical protein